MIATAIGLLYILLGIFGFIGNTAIILLIVTIPRNRKSAYILMANIALADSIMASDIGCLVGFAVLQRHELHDVFQSVICFLHITAWLVVVLSYGALALNRCIGVCYANTRAALYNKPSVAAIVNTLIWLVAIVLGIDGTIPSAVLGFSSELYSVVYDIGNNSNKAETVLWINMATNGCSILIQWICSVIVGRKIWMTNKNANRHQSRRRRRRNRKALRKQLRLFFQFFYPSIICATSLIMSSVITLLADNQMKTEYFVIAHIIAISNHMCNPFIYFYFNRKLRQTAGLVFCSCGSAPTCTYDSSFSFGESPFMKISRMVENRSFRTRSVPIRENKQRFEEAREEVLRGESVHHPVLRREISPAMIEMRTWAHLNKAIAEVML